MPISQLEFNNQETVKRIITFIDSQKKDWQKFYRQTIEFHIKNAKSWANVASGKDLTKQIDQILKLKMLLVFSCFV